MYSILNWFVNTWILSIYENIDSSIFQKIISSDQSFRNVECCKCSKMFLNQRSNIPIVLQHCNLSIMPWNIQYFFLGISFFFLIPRKKYWIFQGIIERLQCCKTIGTLDLWFKNILEHLQHSTFRKLCFRHFFQDIIFFMSQIDIKLFTQDV